MDRGLIMGMFLTRPTACRAKMLLIFACIVDNTNTSYWHRWYANFSN